MRLHATRRAAIAQARGLGNPLWDLAGVPASLDQRFAESKSLVDAVSGQNLITFTRASDGAVVNSAGQIEIVAANVPRFTHDPVTLESLGLLVEEQRANGIRNNTMVGAVAGTPGTLPLNWEGLGSSQGLTRTVVGTGVEDGINYIDIRWQGTLTSGLANTTLATPDSQTQIVASSGQTWSGSWFVKVVGGSLANISALSISTTERTSVGAFVTFGLVGITPSGAPLAQQRYSYAKILDGGATTARVTTDIRATASSGAAIDITLRIGMPQLEQGSGATSVIPTAGTSVVRAADVASITGSAFSGFYNQTEGTILASGSRYGTADGRLAGFDSGSISDTYVLTASSARNVVVSSVSNGGFGGGVTTANSFAYLAPIKAAATFSSADNETACLNGGAVASGATTAPSASLTTMRIGAQAGPASFYNGTIQRLTFFPQRLPSSTLQNITL